MTAQDCGASLRAHLVAARRVDAIQVTTFECRSVFGDGVSVTLLMAALILWLPLRGHRFEGKTSHPLTATPAGRTGGVAADITKTAEPAVRARAVESYGKLPLSFEANQGQTDRQVRFLSRASGYSLFLTENEAVLSLRKPGQKAKGKRWSAPG